LSKSSLCIYSAKKFHQEQKMVFITFNDLPPQDSVPGGPGPLSNSYIYFLMMKDNGFSCVLKDNEPEVLETEIDQDPASFSSKAKPSARQHCSLLRPNGGRMGQTTIIKKQLSKRKEPPFANTLRSRRMSSEEEPSSYYKGDHDTTWSAKFSNHGTSRSKKIERESAVFLCYKQ
jgi:hypothetical protein